MIDRLKIGDGRRAPAAVLLLFARVVLMLKLAALFAGLAGVTWSELIIIAAFVAMIIAAVGAFVGPHLIVMNEILRHQVRARRAGDGADAPR